MLIRNITAPGTSVEADLDHRKLSIIVKNGFGFRDYQNIVLSAKVIEDIFTYTTEGPDSVYELAEKLDERFAGHSVEVFDQTPNGFKADRMTVYQVDESSREPKLVYEGSEYVAILQPKPSFPAVAITGPVTELFERR